MKTNILTTYSQDILKKIKNASHSEKVTLLSENYLGSNHISYNVTTTDSRKIAKDWVSEHQDIEVKDLVETLNALVGGESSDEKMMVGKILGYFKKKRAEIDPNCLDYWLDYLVGWAEIDSLCQSNFTDKEMLAGWEKWKELIRKFSRDENISKKRASLVLLTGCVSHNPDERFADLAFENIDNLKAEKDILITKAISWLLRDLIKYHRQRVENYLQLNVNQLSAIAIRETKNKLVTGKKSA